MSHLLISAAHKSSGKTTISLGLCAALTSRGSVVQPFKKGPDYIDPLWLTQASGRACHNLDFHTQSSAEIVSLVAKYSQGSDLVLVEGNKGLHDGMDIDGSNSNAALAALLNAPVVLVIDTRGMTRGIAPLLLGFQQFDQSISIAGVILNQVGGSRHEGKLRTVVEAYTDIPVLGAVRRDPSLTIDERHLGLIPSNEERSSEELISVIESRIADQVDLSRVQAIAAAAGALPESEITFSTNPTRDKLRIGVIRDGAFGFYYPGDLEAFESAGAELVFINSLTDHSLPDIDGLFIGGGFPETHMNDLAANQTMRESIRHAVETGLPVYAECGGLMYLSRRLCWGEQCADMVGVIRGDIVMHDRPQGRGYVYLEETGSLPWPVLSTNHQPIAAHEFHYSKLENLPGNLKFAFNMARGTGINGRSDGLIYKNLVANYTHLRDTAKCHWVSRFLEFVRNIKQNRSSVRSDSQSAVAG
jgi:cobyrinic acid a,c-diamide synthase